MSFVNVIPEFLDSAVQNVGNIGTSLSQANVAAADATTGVLSAGADEVSLAISSLFSNYGNQYQALSAQASEFHRLFLQTLNAGTGAYTGAEAANSSPLQPFEDAVNAPFRAL